MTLVQIRYALTFDAPFHLGTGISAGLVDRTVIRDANGYLYVPASTLKGVLREHCEQLYHFYTGDVQAPTSSVPSPHHAAATLAEFGTNQTLISRIFGTALHPGTLRFNDAEQTDTLIYQNKDRKDESTSYRQMQTSMLTQVRIDRQTRTAADAALYTSEFGISNLTFVGTIKGLLNSIPVARLATSSNEPGTTQIPAPSYALLLLLGGLLMIERLGGNKSTGKGQCSCFIEEVKLDKIVCPETTWQGWIARLDVLSEYPQVQRGQQGGQV